MEGSRNEEFFILKDNRFEVDYDREELWLNHLDQHFIFNVLNMMKYTAYTNQLQMCDLIDDFAKYLRFQLNLLSADEIIDFAQELEVVKAYSNLQILRFPKIKIEYQMEEVNFFLPSYIFLPLVELVFRRALTSAVKSVVITIHSFRESGFYNVELSESGIGFDGTTKESCECETEDICLFRRRLRRLADGELLVTGLMGCERKIRIIIPERFAIRRNFGDDVRREEQEHENYYSR